MLMLQILLGLGVGVMIYAVAVVLAPSKLETPPKKKNADSPPSAEELAKDQKLQGLKSEVAELESQLEKAQAVSIEEKSALINAKEKEGVFSVELKRREEWVAKAEAELTKVRSENVALNSKFAAKENDLQSEFTKGVNLTRQVREIKTILETKELACRLKEDQIQAQKHQIESQIKTINEQLALIAEFNRKEKISEWVPKSEFNQLNAEYTKLEKELEASQERLKSFAVEIAQLRQKIDKSAPAAEVIKLPEVIPEKIPQEKSAPEVTTPKEIVSVEIKPQGLKLEENKVVEENKKAEENNAAKENIEKKIKETESPK